MSFLKEPESINSAIDLDDLFQNPQKNNQKPIPSNLSELMEEHLPLLDGNQNSADRLLGQKRRRESFYDF